MSLHVFNLEELCPEFSWLCPIKTEGLCPDDHCGALRLWCPIQSVPWGNRGEKPTIHEGPFSKKKVIEHPGRTGTPMRKRGGPRHPSGDLGRSVEKACTLTLLTRWANCVTISKCQGHVTILKCQGHRLFYHNTTASVLDSLCKVF